MFEIKWVRINALLYEYRHHEYTFRRKGPEGAYRYELWLNGQLADNTLGIFDVLVIIRDGYRKVVK